ncbi:uncharacterized protein LOC125241151 isoform X3 [Leguminivora glycinivorella]|uniref:uncharacterized protein LOC125241151 isoform X3 n=1 Tax=Leguminivora glycinivorella TaxID=1035111 RepID=UPI00200FBB43|nr:uncharacterized protein LOC125241151 isoform X3 [Leguminivora glycinivorella]
MKSPIALSRSNVWPLLAAVALRPMSWLRRKRFHTNELFSVDQRRFPVDRCGETPRRWAPAESWSVPASPLPPRAPPPRPAD